MAIINNGRRYLELCCYEAAESIITEQNSLITHSTILLGILLSPDGVENESEDIAGLPQAIKITGQFNWALRWSRINCF
jgi:hypothetical protein